MASTPKKGDKVELNLLILMIYIGVAYEVYSKVVGKGSSWSCVLLCSGASKLFVSGSDAAVQLVCPPTKQVVCTRPLNLSSSIPPKCAYTHHRDLALVGDKSP